MEQSRIRRNAVGPTIRRLRVKSGLTQRLLVARCGVAGFEIPRGTLAKIEAQVRGVSDVELFVLALALGVPVQMLFPKEFRAQLRSSGWLR